MINVGRHTNRIPTDKPSHLDTSMKNGISSIHTGNVFIHNHTFPQMLRPSHTSMQLKARHRPTNPYRHTKIRPSCNISAAQGIQVISNRTHQHVIILNTFSDITVHQQRITHQQKPNWSCENSKNTSDSGEINQKSGNTSRIHTKLQEKIALLNTSPENLLSHNKRSQTHWFSGLPQPSPWLSCKLLDYSLLHDRTTTGRVKKFETPSSRIQLDDLENIPINEQQRLPFPHQRTYIYTHANMADEGNVMKKARHDISKEATGNDLVNESLALLEQPKAPSSLHGATSPSHGKKRSASALITPEKTLIPQTDSPPPPGRGRRG